MGDRLTTENITPPVGVKMTKANAKLRSRAMKAFSDPRFKRFIGCLLAHEERSKVAAQLQREGVDLLRVFLALRTYVEGRSITSERRKREKQDLNIINEGVRKHGVAPEIGRWLRDRNQLARSVNGLGRVHNVDSLGALHIYMELRTRRKVSMGELSYLLDAANRALGLQPDYADPKNLQHELARWRKNEHNSQFIKDLTADIKSKL